MKIQNLFAGDNNIRKSADSSKPKQAEAKPGAADGAKSVSSAGYVREQSEAAAFKVDPEFPPRIELVNQARERVAQGDYDKRYVLSIAKKLIDLPIINDVIDEAEMNSRNDSPDRVDRVEQAREQVQLGHYDDPAVREKIAENLISALGLDFLAQD